MVPHSIPRRSRLRLFSRFFAPAVRTQPGVFILAILVTGVVVLGLALQFAAIAG